MNKSSNLFLGGIFVAGMATTYLLQKTKVLGAENRVFNAPCTGNYTESKSLTADGYETNAPSGYTQAYSEITKPHLALGTNCYMNCYKVTTSNGIRWKNTLQSAKRTAHQVGNMTPWKDMTKAPQTSCPNCCTSGSSTSSPPAGSTSGNGSSGGGSSTSSSTTSCPACDSCCPTVTCPECMDCPAPTKCDSCCPPCQNNAGQSTFLRRFFGR